jgi:hypothetical protein
MQDFNLGDYIELRTTYDRVFMGVITEITENSILLDDIMYIPFSEIKYYEIEG